MELCLMKNGQIFLECIEKLMFDNSYTKCMIEYSSQLSEDGTYQLEVYTREKFGEHKYVSTKKVVPISEQFYLALMRFFKLTTDYISPQNATSREATPILEYKRLSDTEIEAVGL